MTSRTTLLYSPHFSGTGILSHLAAFAPAVSSSWNTHPLDLYLDNLVCLFQLSPAAWVACTACCFNINTSSLLTTMNNLRDLLGSRISIFQVPQCQRTTYNFCIPQDPDNKDLRLIPQAILLAIFALPFGYVTGEAAMPNSGLLSGVYNVSRSCMRKEGPQIMCFLSSCFHHPVHWPTTILNL